MRNICTAIIVLLSSLSARAQSIRVCDFRQDMSAPMVEQLDFNGQACSAIRIPTTDRDFCFEAGYAGIVDVVYTADDVTIYIPCDAHVLSVSHRVYGVLRDWVIPASLRQGETYVLKLACGKRGAEGRDLKPVQFARSLPSSCTVVRSPRPKVKNGSFASSFLDLSFGVAGSSGDWTDLVVAGMSYTYIRDCVGPYAGAYCMEGAEGDPSLSAVMGACARLTRGGGPVDWQFYGGAGLDMTARPVLELGSRIDIGSRRSWGRWDFGVGCMYWDGKVAPKVSVGLGLWGGGILLAVGITCMAI